MIANRLFSFKLWMVLCFLNVSVSTTNICNFDVKLTQILLNEGFHRNLTYRIVLNEGEENERLLYEGCVVGLDQTLPPGVYVYPDELSELRRVNKLNAIPKNRVNIELPAEQSTKSSVFLAGPVQRGQAQLWVPVHARYHRATASGQTARNEIDAPTLYLHCPDQRLNHCQGISANTSFLCSGTSKEKCNWKTIAYTLMMETPIWDIPLGNTDHYYLVAIGTTWVTIVGSMYLFMAIRDIKLKLKARLRRGNNVRQ